jgi:hypothetical protein
MHVIQKNDAFKIKPNFSLICAHKSLVMRLQKFKRPKTM